MPPYPRKLLPENQTNETYYATLSVKSSTPEFEERESPTTTTNLTSNGGNGGSSYSTLKLNPPFDSALALTILVLLTALFFMGFFSVYIRRFADDPPPRRRRSSGEVSPESSSYCVRKPKGVDPTTVKSLPVHGYSGEGAKQGIIKTVECAICLGEFEEREWVKEIPYCGHVFHVECIDTWLESHVTCPLCRTDKLFPEGHVAEVEEEGRGRGLGVGEVHGESDGEVRLVVVEDDTWRGEREVGSSSIMCGTGTGTSSTSGNSSRNNSSRNRSGLWFGEKLMLNRSLSF